MHYGILIAASMFVVISSIPSCATPDVDRSERNGLSDYEWATLWSRDVDSDRGTPPPSRAGELYTIAGQTDFTFYEPPSTAGRWSARDFHDYEPGGVGESIAPRSAELSNAGSIKDAFVSIFAIQPSTILHIDGETTRTYIAGNGTVTAAVDYRVESPPNESTPTTTVNWTVADHEIVRVWLTADGIPLAEVQGTHSPEITYDLPSTSVDSLHITAEITATLERTVVRYTNESETTSNRSTRHREIESRSVTRESDSVTVRDSIQVSVYSPTVTERTAVYPDGSQSTAYTVDEPFNGITTSSGRPQILTNLRFYTARDPRWDTLIYRTSNRHRRIQSPASPVSVHAYPSKRGSRTVPFGAGISVDHVSGAEFHSPSQTIDHDVHVDVVEEGYPSISRVVVGNSETLREGTVVRGLLPSTGPISVESTIPEEIRETELVGRVVDQHQGAAIVKIELREKETGTQIHLVSEIGGRSPAGTMKRDTGYITVNGDRYRTNESGIVLVQIQRPGVYPVRYHPGTWTDYDPSFAGDSTTIRWHPIATIHGWTAFGVQVLLVFLPLFAILYAGREVRRIFGRKTNTGDHR